MNLKKKALVITTIASSKNSILRKYANISLKENIDFIIVGDKKSPSKFLLNGANYFFFFKQKSLKFNLSKILPINHYSRKNLGYLKHIWPRGFALEELNTTLSKRLKLSNVICPIQQGLADKNPDVDAIYRLTSLLPIKFNSSKNISLGNGSICPFNSQNTGWLREAYPLMYLPSYCSFRMTDIWRSFIAQRVAWTCGWNILFHSSTVTQERNEHNLIHDLEEEVSGYVNNFKIMKSLIKLKLKPGVKNIKHNMILCYKELIIMNLIDKKELKLLNAWFLDLKNIKLNNY